MKKEVLTTFEIKDKVERVPIAFVVKEEVEKPKGTKIMQKNINLNGIPKLIQEYNIKYLNYLYHRNNQHSQNNHTILIALIIDFLLFPHIAP